ncbi:DNA-3-methyladenine glycosylase [Paenisporosarcina cavernae]|uniref:DNA-3-methyladenine glycosylase n=1 Tax=Paenisporosarcina cavernae TaxID=2320858 RepID=UPI001EE61403|nr:DNA-3-methyladenine glycosylase [Paenisporosarcina cavernae]
MKFEALSREFYQKPTLELSSNLIGTYLVHEHSSGTLAVKIVEVEAYLGAVDRAAHSFGNRRTKRTEVMFGGAGSVYMYQMHRQVLMNVVSGPEGTPEAILIRAGEPILGESLMQEFRDGRKKLEWTNGPGKLSKALDVSMEYYGHKWWEQPLYIAKGESVQSIETGPRVGIGNSLEAVHYPYRFFEKDNPYVSKFRP